MNGCDQFETDKCFVDSECAGDRTCEGDWPYMVCTGNSNCNSYTTQCDDESDGNGYESFFIRRPI